MPTVTLNKKVFESLVGKKLDLDKLKDRISMLGTDLEKIEGNEIHVEVFPNRPDMLSEQGFARAFSAFIGVHPGLREYTLKHSGEKTIVKNLPKEWPYAVTAIVKGLQFSDEKIREVVQIQEKLAVTYLRNRKKGGIGIYPLDKIKFPITVVGKDPKEIVYRPLEFPKAISAQEILEKHPTGKKYGHICKDWKKFPVFIDASGQILSMPPIVNSHEMGKVNEKTRDVFIEATGTDLETVKIAITILATALADMGGQIYSMDVVYEDKKLTIPDLSAHKMQVDTRFVNRLLGLDLKEQDVKKLLERMGYGYANGVALVPAYRADILHPIDLVEDIAIAYGYENFEGRLPAVATIGKESDAEILKRIVANILIGMGLLEVQTYHLTNEENHNRKMTHPTAMIRLSNALTADYDALRNWMIPSLLNVLSMNTHYEYPQMIFEIGRVFIEDASVETGVREPYRLAVVLCGPEFDFTRARQVFDALMVALDLQYDVAEVEHPSFIPGRVGRVAIGKATVAYIGEIAPQVLTNWRIEMPTAGFELNISDLLTVMKK